MSWQRYVAIGDSFTEGMVDEHPDAHPAFVGAQVRPPTSATCAGATAVTTGPAWTNLEQTIEIIERF